jgi:DNA repair exonuclease SbcCD ATPase subunit
MAENIFTIEADKIRTMKKDIASAEREELNMAQGSLDSQKENVKNQLELEREKATIAELAKQQKELDKQQALTEEPVLPMPINQTADAAATIPEPQAEETIIESPNVPSPQSNEIKIPIFESDSEKETLIQPAIIEEETLALPEPPEDMAAIEELKETPETDIPPIDENQIDIGEITGLRLEPQAETQPTEDALSEDIGDIELQAPEIGEKPEEGELQAEMEEIPTMKTEEEQEIEEDVLDLNSLSDGGDFESDLEEPAELEKELGKNKTQEPKGSISLNNLPVENMESPIETASLDTDFDDSIFETSRVETPEEKLRKINDLIFEVEQNLLQISEEKIPFEERKKDIEREMDKSRQRLDLIAERKKRIDELKKTTEEKEKSDQSPEEKRNTEKERWKIEDERNAVEEEKNKKEDEIKSLRLQLKECDFNFEKVLSREKELNMELALLKRDHTHLILEQEKQGLLSELEKLEVEANSIKDIMTDNTAEKESIEKRLGNIMTEEKSVEEEIKVIEKRSDMSVPPAELRRMEELRKAAEEKRRLIEEKRWASEDDLDKAEQLRAELREKYQSFSTKVNALKSKITEINDKLNKKD